MFGLDSYVKYIYQIYFISISVVYLKNIDLFDI